MRLSRCRCAENGDGERVRRRQLGDDRDKTGANSHCGRSGVRGESRREIVLMGQRPKTLTPEASPRHLLGAELRRWRVQRRLSAAGLASMVYVSPDLVLKVERAERRATPDLVAACDAALDTGGALRRLMQRVAQDEQEPVLNEAALPRCSCRPGTTLQRLARPVSILPKLAARAQASDLDGDEERPNAGGARIYRFPWWRTRDPNEV
jgi:transcriptional regulator with XRE-family HTH domain